MKFIGDEFFFPGTASQVDLESASQADGIPWKVTGGSLAVISGRGQFTPPDPPAANYNVMITNKSGPVEGKYVVALKAIPSGQWQVVRSAMRSSLPGESGLKNSDYGVILAAKSDLSSYYRVSWLWQDGMSSIPEPPANVFRVVNGHVVQMQPASNAGVDEFVGALLQETASVYVAALFTPAPPQQFGTNTSTAYSQPGALIVSDGFSGNFYAYVDSSPLTGAHAGFFLQDTVRGHCDYWEIDNGDQVTTHCLLNIDASIRTSPAVTAHTTSTTAATPTGGGGVPTYTGSRVDENYNNYSNGTPPTTTSGGTTNSNPGDAFEGGEFDDGPDPATL